MKAGDRVLIKSKEHPWHGEVGTLTDDIVKRYPDGNMYRVLLDNGVGAGATLAELEKL